MEKHDLKKLFLEERPQLNNYLKKIDFSMNQVISIESLPPSLATSAKSITAADAVTTRRFVFRGMGFVFSVGTNDQYSFFRPELKFNEIQVECQAG